MKKKVDYEYATPFGELNGFMAFCAKMKKKWQAKRKKMQEKNCKHES
ncbi:MAG: hypothetical protein LUH10_17785 [Tannerellaceae bacterium]|nr:hypothetical protein [Tannerellaceae bacterium]